MNHIFIECEWYDVLIEYQMGSVYWNRLVHSSTVCNIFYQFLFLYFLVGCSISNWIWLPNIFFKCKSDLRFLALFFRFVTCVGRKKHMLNINAHDKYKKTHTESSEKKNNYRNNTDMYVSHIIYISKRKYMHKYYVLWLWRNTHWKCRLISAYHWK